AGKIGVAFWKRAFQLLGAVQPIRGIFDARGAGGSPPQRVGGAARTKLEGSRARRQESGYFFQKPATARRKNPGRDFFGGASGAVVFLDKALQLIFKGGIC